MNIRILYVEDDLSVRLAGTQTMQLNDFNVVALESAEEALPYLEAEDTWVLLTDIRLPGMSGMELLKHSLGCDRELPVILVTGHGDIHMAVQAMHTGAYDFLEKPYTSERLSEVLKRAVFTRRLVLENRRLKTALGASTRSAALIGSSSAMQLLRQTLSDLADTDVDVLVYGETGTGKEQVARALHYWGRRRSNDFVAINCAAVPEQVFESEVFGHEAGAFTSASKRRIGRIEQADHGTLFLDEIEGMPMVLQTRLLRVLQERVVERLGSNTLIPVDCRVVSATKADLLALSRERLFREDLYFRLGVVPLFIPPLRHRLDDIDELFPWFVSQAALRFQRPAPEITTAFLTALKSRDWPGNVRELRNVADRFVLNLPALLSVQHGQQSDGGLAGRMNTYERSVLIEALTTTRGQVSDAARQLKLARKTMYDKLTRHEIDPERFR